ncbi:MAG: hypothetical protein MK132_13465 [Lentisphaerales bacterium]|nr:hypothetical protein [Lentisphaerales bacterium]
MTGALSILKMTSPLWIPARLAEENLMTSVTFIPISFASVMTPRNGGLFLLSTICPSVRACQLFMAKSTGP